MPVHARTADHRKGIGKRVGIAITDAVGTMGCAAVFALIALTSLPSTLVNTGWVPRSAFPSFLLGQGLIGLVSWIAQTFLQLVLLSIIIVGQNASAEASDARAAKTFEDTELLVDRLNTETQGGITTVLNEVRAARSDTALAMETFRSILAATPPPAEASKRPAKPPAGGGM